MVAIRNFEFKYEVQEGNESQQLRLTVSQPVRTPSGSFEVVYELSGATSSRTSVFGETQVQALALAMKVIAAEMAGISRTSQLRESESGRLVTAEFFTLS